MSIYASRQRASAQLVKCCVSHHPNIGRFTEPSQLLQCGLLSQHFEPVYRGGTHLTSLAQESCFQRKVDHVENRESCMQMVWGNRTLFIPHSNRGRIYQDRRRCNVASSSNTCLLNESCCALCVFRRTIDYGNVGRAISSERKHNAPSRSAGT